MSDAVGVWCGVGRKSLTGSGQSCDDDRAVLILGTKEGLWGVQGTREAIEWVLRRLDIGSSHLRGVVTVVVIVLIALIIGIAIAAFLMFLARRVGPLIFGGFFKNVKFIPVVDVLIIVTTTAPVWLSTRSLPFTALAGVGAILAVYKEQAKLREVQEERKKEGSTLGNSPHEMLLWVSIPAGQDLVPAWLRILCVG